MEISEALNLDKWMDKFFELAWKIVKIPFLFWDGLPAWVKLTVYSFFILLALVMIFITWKGRNEWRRRV